MWSDVEISFSENTENSSTTLVDHHAEYTLNQNEHIQFYSPNLIEKDTYSNYVKFEYKLKNDVPANTDYQLSSQEYIIFYWRNSSDEPYQYHSYGSNTIIHPTFALEGNVNQNIFSFMQPESKDLLSVRVVFLR